MKESYEFIAEKDMEAVRIDKFLTDNLEDLSRSMIQNLIKSGNIFVNDKQIKANYRIRPMDHIVANIPEAKEINITQEDIPLDIIYEDDDILIVNKPKGMVVHPSNGHESGTLVNAILYHCKGQLSGINGEIRPGIVHRIDMDTTGSLIICKNDNAHRFIAEQIAVHSINRIYEGIVHGIVKEDEGTIHTLIGRSPTDRKKMAVLKTDGREAITHFKVLKRFKNYTYCEFKLETGRTHQIRVHMASINHPLVGDEVYGPKKCPFKLQGQTLHAKTIGFIHPRSREYVEFTAPTPNYFNELLKKLD
ncbi:MAG: RluA family pseudouridine synthase [Lachnospiraceae bacterium]|nr:RluA family pseudouridine synthase [Lachnospiraceae bacterium]